MRFIKFLTSVVLGFTFVVGIQCNTEKVIFNAPAKSEIEYKDQLRVKGDLHSRKLLSRTKIPVAFPSTANQRGRDTWILLNELQTTARYEVRVCWAATAPTDFWLSVHDSITDQIDLEASAEDIKPSQDRKQTSHLFLKISAAASYYTNNNTLMENPPDVLVDIILDRYVFGFLPLSLCKIAGFIVLIGFVSWFAGIWLVRRIYDLRQDERIIKRE